MFQKVNSLLTKVNEAAGVELYFHNDNKVEVWVVVLKRNRKLVQIVEKKEFTGDQVEQVLQQLPKDVPLAIAINGKGVLHKKVESIEDEMDDNKLASVAFPSINFADFYTQRFDLRSGAILSIIRKEFLDKLFTDFKTHKFQVLSLSLGPFGLDNYLSLLGFSEGMITTKGHILTINEGQIDDYKFTSAFDYDKTWKIGEELIEDKFLLPYISSLGHFVGITSEAKHNIQQVYSFLEEWKQKQIFVKAGWGVLIGCFVILLANFLLFSQFNERNGELLSSVEFNKTSINELNHLEGQVKERKAFLQSAGWLNNTKSSFYADRIASTVPPEIALLELNINPLDQKKTKLEKKPVIINNRIVVKGSCSDPAVLNKWLGKVKKFDWVKDIREQNYVYDYNKKVGNFDFNIELKD